MAEAPEIPEAKDAFEKLVAVSIAVMAVVLSVVGNRSDNAKTEAIIKTTAASNKWGYFQAKSIKDHIQQAEIGVLSTLSTGATESAKRDAALAKLNEEMQRLEKEKTEIKTEAEHLDGEALQALKINDRCDQGGLLLQIAVVLASVAIVSRLKPLWWMSLAIGAVGAVIGLSAFLL
jgi:Domain of unknown function (DUF4337)